MDNTIYVNSVPTEETKISTFEPGVSYLGVAPHEEVAMMKHIEECGRICYRSEHHISDTSHIGFLSRILERGHTSVLGHANVCIAFDHLMSYARDDAEYKTSLAQAMSWLATNLSRRDYFVTKRIKPNDLTEFKDSGIDLGLRRDFIFYKNSAATAGIIAGSLRAWVECLGVVTKPTFIGHVVFKTLYPTISRLAFGESFYNSIPELNTAVTTVQIVSTDNQLALLRKKGWDLPQFSFRFTTDRGISHELVRHQTLAISQESTRYVNYNKRFGFRFFDFVQDQEDTMRRNSKDGLSLGDLLKFRIAEGTVHGYTQKCVEAYQMLLSYGFKPQVARDILPHSLATELVMSGRWSFIESQRFEVCKGWSHFLLKRADEGAHPHVRTLALKVYDHFASLGLMLPPSMKTSTMKSHEQSEAL